MLFWQVFNIGGQQTHFYLQIPKYDSYERNYVLSFILWNLRKLFQKCWSVKRGLWVSTKTFGTSSYVSVCIDYCIIGKKKLTVNDTEKPSWFGETLKSPQLIKVSYLSAGNVESNS